VVQKENTREMPFLFIIHFVSIFLPGKIQGMALYTGLIDLGDSVGALLRSDRPDGLFPTVVADERGAVLGMAYSNRETLKLAIKERKGIYYSRKRGVWRKGETSGAMQELLKVFSFSFSVLLFLFFRIRGWNVWYACAR
jgi:hypothetical protein